MEVPHHGLVALEGVCGEGMFPVKHPEVIGLKDGDKILQEPIFTGSLFLIAITGGFFKFMKNRSLCK